MIPIPPQAAAGATSATAASGKAAAITAGSQAGANLLMAIPQGMTNRKNRKFAIQIMNTERQWALEDAAAQNVYNSPAAQKQRLKDAELNPSLMYGGSGHVESSSIVRPTQGARSQAQAPDFSAFANLLPQLAQLKLIQKQIDGLTLDNENKKMDNAMKADTYYNENPDQANNPYYLQTQIAYEQLDKINMENQITRRDQHANQARVLNESLISGLKLLQEEYNNKEILPLTKMKLAQDIKMVETAIKGAQNDNVVKRMNAELAKDGITPSDNTYLRMSIQWLNEHGLNPLRK